MPEIQSHIEYYSGLWEACPVDFPFFPRVYNRDEQLLRELRFDAIQEKVKKLQQKNDRQTNKPGDPGKIFFPVLREFMENVFDFEGAQLEIILSDRFKEVSKDFFYRARKFGPELSPENIYQGLRNVWIMNGLQLMMGIPVEITPSVFAYSMIYPYSDNLLDGPDLSVFEKQRFSKRFNMRLHGDHIEPENFAEKQLFMLVSMIEGQFPREEFPEVFESLYGIQQGQTRSLQLIDCNGPEEGVVRNIRFEKGGASVLADGYLVAGRLTPLQEQALFGYGVYLQMLDDIQDITEDTLAKTKTLFACRENKALLEALINKTIHFGRLALEKLACFEGTEMNQMLKLMNHSIESMMIESVGLSPGLYSGMWLQNLEKHFPVSLKFLREKKSKSKSQRFDIFKKYFDQLPGPVIPPKNSTEI